jgi:hypothetical protein
MLSAQGLKRSVGRPRTCWDSKNHSQWYGRADLTRAGIDHGVLALTCRSSRLPLFPIR